ncbi:nicotinate (nicotinamide) nucleotide adenylyltransferase [[Clostridium] innocuum]|uniref:nicotinate (nicotinamide) nucleotide adenylyltransferase n=1 Tax=Clostridium innocuum TaxID=1522 RepID=UPI000D6ABF1D|nr:nicotinate (nicotinamide) nucleotide adenylyltransferase [[Clostridium] innocuum]PWJ12049.1 nicotinate-nucleotide adenylyltransferase [[Clostridium] innocuum]SSA47670.1 nicotinate-nucleotide adenylyltransferase [[Clostridium] innocuum]
MGRCRIKRVIVFGGSFNPPTLAHKYIINHALERFPDSEVLVVPTNDAYPKPDKAPAKERYAMLKDIFRNDSDIAISDIELRQNTIVYTVDLLAEVRKKYPNADEIYLMMGSDNLEDFTHWRCPEAILSQYRLLILNRTKDADDIINAAPLLKKYRDRIKVIEDSMPYEFKQISATKVRNCIRTRMYDKLKEYVPKEITESVIRLYDS